jgi:Xaa-Pro aminopeptidase
MTALAPSTTAISDAEHADRRRRAEEAARRAGLDALIAFSATNQLGPSAYLTGYEPRFGPREIALVILVPGGRATLIAYAYWDEIGPMPWLDEVVIKPSLPEMARLAAERIPPGAKRIGIVGYPLFPASFATALGEAHPVAALEDATALLLELAVIKTEAEVAILRECAGMTDAAVRAFLEGAREGVAEPELGLAVEAAMIRAGASRPAFPPLIFSGPRVEVGIGFPAPRRLRSGEQVNIVCGALHRGYKMDVGRVTAVDRPSPETARVMETAAAMIDAMSAVIRPGTPVAAVADAAMRVVRERGMDEWRWPYGAPGYVGHGIGCWLDEAPRLRSGEDGALAAGMVLVLEARLGRRGHGGAALTDPVLVTGGGAERLSAVPIRTW